MEGTPAITPGGRSAEFRPFGLVLLTVVWVKDSESTAKNRISKPNTDDLRATILHSGSCAPPISSWKHRCDPKPGGISYAVSPVVWSLEPSARRTLLRKQPERHHRHLPHAFVHSSYSTSSRAAATADVILAETRYRCSGLSSQQSRDIAPPDRIGTSLGLALSDVPLA